MQALACHGAGMPDPLEPLGGREAIPMNGLSVQPRDLPDDEGIELVDFYVKKVFDLGTSPRWASTLSWSKPSAIATYT